MTWSNARYATPYAAVGLGLYVLNNVWWAVVLYQGVMVAGVVGRRGRCVVGRWSVGLLIGGLLGAGGVALVVQALCPALWINDLDVVARLAGLGLTPGSYGLFIAYLALTVPALEECYWRGKPGSARAGLSGTDLWFAGYHLLVLVLFLKWFLLPLSFAVLVAASWGWRRIARRLDGVGTAAVLHVLADVSVLSVALGSLRSV